MGFAAADRAKEIPMSGESFVARLRAANPIISFGSEGPATVSWQRCL